MRPLVRNALRNTGSFNLGRILWRDAAAEIDAPGRQERQGEVTRCRPVERHEQLEGLHAQGRLTAQRRLRDDSIGVLLPQACGQPGRLLAAACFAQEPVDVLESRTRDDPFVAHPRKLSQQKLEQVHFQAVARGEIHMAPFGGKWPVSCPVPVNPRLAEAGPRRDEGEVTCCVTLAWVEHGEIVR